MGLGVCSATVSLFLNRNSQDDQYAQLFTPTQNKLVAKIQHQLQSEGVLAIKELDEELKFSQLDGFTIFDSKSKESKTFGNSVGLTEYIYSSKKFVLLDGKRNLMMRSVAKFENHELVIVAKYNLNQDPHASFLKTLQVYFCFLTLFILFYLLFDFYFLAKVRQLLSYSTEIYKGDSDFRRSDRTFFGMGDLGRLGRRIHKISSKWVFEESDFSNSHLNLLQEKELADEESKRNASFLANMSHEIRTPINGILGMASLLSYTQLDKNQVDLLSKITSCGEGLLTIVNDVLDISKFEAGKMSLEKEPFKVSDCIDSAVLLIEKRAADKGIPIVIEVDPDVPEFLVGDVTRIRQVMVNLLGNAVKFTDSGAIEVSVKGRELEKSRYKFYVAVKDQGVGITQKNQLTIFDSYTQADATVTRRYGGTGLGLSITKNLVEAMNGDIGLHSELGQGSTFFFHIELEVYKGASIAMVEEEGQGATEEGGEVTEANQLISLAPRVRVLVAEDNEVNQIVIGKFLDRLGFSYTIVENGLEAIRKCEENEYDLIFMDMKMPVLDGIEATRKLREKGVTCSVIAMTANIMDKDKKTCFDAGMDEFIGKPVRFKELESLMNRLVTETLVA